MAAEVALARGYLLRGEPLHRFVPRRVALDLRMFSAGGLALCDAIAAQDHDTLPGAPPPAGWAARGSRAPPLRRARARAGMTLEEAHRHCREVARREARNFYYGFILLPPDKRAGIYAAYAFSRRADDSVNDDGPAAAPRGRRRGPARAARRGRRRGAAPGRPRAGGAGRHDPRASRSRGSTWTP